jgi:CheY-like chemotaxis protein
MTAETSKKAREDAVAAGCDDFQLKPIDFEGLIEKIKSLVGGGAKP